MSLIIDILLILVALGATIIIAAPIIVRLAPGARWLTKVCLSFSLGYVILSLSGIAGPIIGLDPVVTQGVAMLTGFGVFLVKDFKPEISRVCVDREDWAVFGIGSTYLFFCIFYFDSIIMWMGGDALAHAEIIRMLLDGSSVPVAFPPLGSYWEYYPKGFHFYSYLWARVFPLLEVVRTIPVLLTLVTPFLLYSTVREAEGDVSNKKIALYAFILACLAFPAHYSYLIWAGYPSAAAEMLLAAAVLAIIVDMKLLTFFLLGILFSHARLLLLACGVLLIWLAMSHLSRRLPSIIGGSAVLMAIAAIALPVHRPEFSISVATSQSMASEYAARWYPAFLSLFGAVLALYRRSCLDRLAMSWAIAVIIMLILADIGLLDFAASPDRILLGLYLPLSLLGAYALSEMDQSTQRIQAGFATVLVLVGAAIMGVVFFSYASSWALPQQDYQAMVWLQEQNFSDALCINLDETGSWIYPLTGIATANPRIIPGIYSFNRKTIGMMRADPGSPSVMTALGSKPNKRYLIYLSSISVSHPGYKPPFDEYRESYPQINFSLLRENYDTIYSNGAYIFGYPRGAFRV